MGFLGSMNPPRNRGREREEEEEALGKVRVLGEIKESRRDADEEEAIENEKEEIRFFFTRGEERRGLL